MKCENRTLTNKEIDQYISKALIELKNLGCVKHNKTSVFKYIYETTGHRLNSSSSGVNKYSFWMTKNYAETSYRNQCKDYIGLPRNNYSFKLLPCYKQTFLLRAASKFFNNKI